MKLKPYSEIGLIIRADEIPDRSTVSKRTGTVRYILRHKIDIYGKGKEDRKTIQAKAGTVMLVGESGNVNIYPGDTKFIWHLTVQDLLFHYQNSREEE